MSNVTSLAEARSDELEAEGTPDAMECLKRIQDSMKVLEEARADQDKTKADAKKDNERAKAAFVEAMEKSVSVSEKKAEVIGKLRGIESTYQEMNDTAERTKIEKRDAGKMVKEALGALERAVKESVQATLPGID